MFHNVPWQEDWQFPALSEQVKARRATEWRWSGKWRGTVERPMDGAIRMAGSGQGSRRGGTCWPPARVHCSQGGSSRGRDERRRGVSRKRWRVWSGFRRRVFRNGCCEHSRTAEQVGYEVGFAATGRISAGTARCAAEGGCGVAVPDSGLCPAGVQQGLGPHRCTRRTVPGPTPLTPGSPHDSLGICSLCPTP